MIVTCTSCPRQLSFLARHIDEIVRLFGWSRRDGRFVCAGCREGA